MKSYVNKLLSIASGKYAKRIKPFFPYLENGKFTWNYTLSYLSISGSDVSFLDNITDMVLSDAPQVKKIIAAIMNVFFSIKNTNASNDNELNFHGNVLMLSCKNNDIKIFDLNNHLVLSSFQDSARFDRIVSGYSFFDDFFSVKNEHRFFDNMMLERLIDNNTSFSANECFDFFIKKYLLIYSSIKISRSQFDNSILSITDECIKKFKDIIPNNEFILCKQHGDFWKSNVLCEKGEYYLIDFEKFGDHYYLMDLLYFWMTEYIFNDNIEGIKKFFEGEYDNDLRKIHELLGLQYRKKDIIFSEFIVYMWYFKWNEENSIPYKQLNTLYEDYFGINGE